MAATFSVAATTWLACSCGVPLSCICGTWVGVGVFVVLVVAGEVFCEEPVCDGVVVGVALGSVVAGEIVSVVDVTVVVVTDRSMLDVGWPVAKESDPVEVSESCEDPQPTKASVATTKVNAICFLITRTVLQMRVKARKIYGVRGFLPAQICFGYLDGRTESFLR